MQTAQPLPNQTVRKISKQTFRQRPRTYNCNQKKYSGPDGAQILRPLGKGNLGTVSAGPLWREEAPASSLFPFFLSFTLPSLPTKNKTNYDWTE